MTNAYEYVKEAGGLELESDYPYAGSDGKCKYTSNKVAAKVANFTNIPVDEDQVAAYLVQRGPLASEFLCLSYCQSSLFFTDLGSSFLRAFDDCVKGTSIWLEKLNTPCKKLFFYSDGNNLESLGLLLL